MGGVETVFSLEVGYIYRSEPIGNTVHEMRFETLCSCRGQRLTPPYLQSASPAQPRATGAEMIMIIAAVPIGIVWGAARITGPGTKEEKKSYY